MFYTLHNLTYYTNQVHIKDDETFTVLRKNLKGSTLCTTRSIVFCKENQMHFPTSICIYKLTDV